MTEHFDGELTREEILASAPPGVYRVAGAVPRVEPQWYDMATDTTDAAVVVTVARVRIGRGQLPTRGECYRDGEREVIFTEAPL